MRIVNSMIGCTLLAFALLHCFIPGSLHLVAIYVAGAALSLYTLKTGVPVRTARVLAIATTAVMFFYFAGFFRMAPYFHEYWYRSSEAVEAVGMLLSAFAMIPILSCYSCMLKAECQEAMQARRARKAKTPAFFSVPDSIS